MRLAHKALLTRLPWRFRRKRNVRGGKGKTSSGGMMALGRALRLQARRSAAVAQLARLARTPRTSDPQHEPPPPTRPTKGPRRD